MAKLLIVESPGKLKTLRKILGGDWILEASVGHTTELAHDGNKKLGFDIGESQIETRYIPRGTRGKQVLSKLRAASKNAEMVYLAMDPDREGEAIAWHLVEQLRLKKFVRVSYTQITDSAVKAAIQNPRKLDLPLIHAQRARQCLDKLVGYEVSPLLWNSTGGKSAGRVQSATLHLICERERERLAFVPEDYWTLQALYNEGLVANFEKAKVPGDSEPRKVSSALEAKQIETTARTSPHVVKNLQDREEKRLPLPPLITSSLQQTAGGRLKFSPQKTMKVAQELYEGIQGKGLITYMRTDAVTLSPEFIQDARSWLTENAPQALADRPPVFRTKADSQGAHEAIRPTSVAYTPEIAKQNLSGDQYQIYRLIWERAVASQCRAARLARSEIEIMAGNTRWVSRGMRVIEKGYLEFWRNIEDEKELPALILGQVLNLRDLKIEAKKTQAPSRYSEAKLVQLMEKLGIGRPSTYASTIMTLRDREYVILEKDVLAPTDLGMKTDQFLMRAMPDLVDVRFTADMEKSLDQIAENKMGWEKFLCDWNHGYLTQALVGARGILSTMPKIPSQFGQSKWGRGKKAGGGAKRSTSDSGTKKKFSFAKKGAKRKSAATSAATSAAKATGDAPSGPAPDCKAGHGPLQSRVSKKGAPYWKCGHAGCDSWAWPK